MVWDNVFLTKKQGGLAIRDLQLWNKACCFKLLRLLFFHPGSMWAKWFKEVISNGSYHNCWMTKPSTSFLWLANKLLKMKHEIFPLIKLQLQNRHSARLWFDNWTPFSSINSLLNTPNSQLGIPLTATVASLYQNGAWQIAPARL